MNRKQKYAEQRAIQRKLFKSWKLHLENGKHTNAQAIRRAKSLSRKGIKINYE
jgi:hypothetical protein